MSKNIRLGRRAISIMFALLALSAPTGADASDAVNVKLPYLYNFNFPGSLPESGAPELSWSGYWWVNSGAYLKMYDGRGYTLQGKSPALDSWRLLYAGNNPLDTDNGYYPQNIFRLLTRSLWTDVRQVAYFIVTADNKSASPNRNASNGLLLMHRYQDDGDTLYYAGVRVDGAAVIKKKLNGDYFTLAYVPGVYPGAYDRETSSNLLPKNKWIGLKSEVITESDGSVLINLYLDKGWQGRWELVASATDDGAEFGPVITGAGFSGIRTDFMDVAFENFRLQSI